ncbi:DUF974-domain-containing protein [Flagelloscypha sp. PMI_526]|nr:DUF974-domain-containing protein [Flagelloscypha sp. PMI_526]
MSLQGKAPLPTNPKTLRDLTMQTSTTKVLLAEFGNSMECLVYHEIKELGQHVLACTVSYKLSPKFSSRDVQQDPSIQTFRKFYKFAVKTKVHAVRSPTAIMSLEDRDKVFLEVHIQNLTPEPLWFEHIRLEPTESWTSVDFNESIDEHCNALMQPQDVRQYVYLLSPKSFDAVPPTLTPGTVIPLGRLDIAWRSSFGEPGRLLTSMLSRRIHAPPPNGLQNPAPAIPPHLKRPQPIRPQSPGPSSVQPTSPPPYRTRTPTSSVSSNTHRTHTPPPPLPTSSVDVHLLTSDIPRDEIRLSQPFDITFSVTATAPMGNNPNDHRTIRLALQHILPPRTTITTSSESQTATAIASPSSLQIISSPSTSGFSTPRSPPAHSSAPHFDYGLAHQKLLTTSPTKMHAADSEGGTDHSAMLLTPPFASGAETEARFAKLAGASYYGHSTVVLPAVELAPFPPHEASVSEETAAPRVLRSTTQTCVLSWVPKRKGLVPIGGIRVLLVEDRVLEHDLGKPNMLSTVLKEVDIVAEVWVSA